MSDVPSRADLGGWIFGLAILWGLFNTVREAIGRAKQAERAKRTRPRGERRVPELPPSPPEPWSAGAPPGSTAPTTATQQEGTLLEQLLRGLETAQREAGAEARTDDATRPAPVGLGGRGSQSRRLPPALDDEAIDQPEAITLEGASLERTDSDRGTRVDVDLDDESFAAERRRLAAAEARLAGRTTGEHERFHRQVQVPVAAPGTHRVLATPAAPADRTAVRAPASLLGEGLTGASLRRSVLLQDVLGPPKALRDDD
ncbi:MAG: hypothetical protein NW201_08920 [Gemmatimonadales bacterium]|nr:hypothetical protein [Gemmatimonadales bacterium]